MTWYQNKICVSLVLVSYFICIAHGCKSTEKMTTETREMQGRERLLQDISILVNETLKFDGKIFATAFPFSAIQTTSDTTGNSHVEKTQIVRALKISAQQEKNIEKTQQMGIASQLTTSSKKGKKKAGITWFHFMLYNIFLVICALFVWIYRKYFVTL